MTRLAHWMAPPRGLLMRKRLLILAVGVVLLALGGAVAVFIVVNRPPTPGGLETAPTDVEIVTSTVPKPKPIKRPPATIGVMLK